MNEIKRMRTSIKGLDEVLGGGIPEGRTMLIAGSAGTGKTVLLNEFLYRGITQQNEGGVFVTFEEQTNDICRNVSGFGWDYEKAIEQGKLAIVDLSQQSEMVISGGKFEWDILFKRIEHAIDKISAKRVAVDSLSAGIGRISQITNKDKVREMMFRFIDLLKRQNVTSFISSEKDERDALLSRYRVEEFVADGVINLSSHFGQNKVVRNMYIIKMRGVGYRSGVVEFDITSDGLEVFPKIPAETTIARTNFEKRLQLGIKGLDEALGGGIPEGHMMMLAGNTGTGKTILGLQFIMEGTKNGEKAIWVALEEPVIQVCKTAEAIGLDIQTQVQNGNIIFIHAELLDLSPDQLLYRVLDAAQKYNVSRVVIDSVSSIESSILDQNKVREILIQISSFFKSKGITCFMNYLSTDNFGASTEQLLSNMTTNEMRLSSIVDGIILLRYVERDQGVHKLLNILKLRGSRHSKEILQYEITDKGFIPGSRFTESGKRTNG